jgi:exo-beta-1,3-glucanase (GH17 family)
MEGAVIRLRVALGAFLIGVIAVMCGCSSSGLGPVGPVGESTVTVTIDFAANDAAAARATIASIKLTVTGPEMATMSRTLTPSGATWTVTLAVPNGIDRKFTADAYETGNTTAIYTGATTQDIAAGANNAVSIRLYAPLPPKPLTFAAVQVGFTNPYLGIGKQPVCLGIFTKAGQNPNSSTVPPEQVAEQIAVASRYTTGIRLYSLRNGNEYAARYGHDKDLIVAGGAWIGPDSAANKVECDAAIALANEGVLSSVIVGSEALLRGDCDEATLAGWVKYVKDRIPAAVKVSCADTWHIWNNGGSGLPTLAAAVDFIVIHCWPYWEGCRINDAVDKVHRDYDIVKALYPTKAVIIGETGWPSAGSAFGAANPGEIEQRRFVADFVAWAKANTVSYYLFELFDEPWKSEGGTGVGPHWGLMTSDYVAKPEMNKIWF